MTAPERIWASSVTENYGEWQTVTDGLPRPTEYVRADLYAALEAQLAERVRVKTLDEDDYEEIVDAAGIALRNASRGARGQTITVHDSLDWWVMKETERRSLSALEATPPAPKVTEAMVEAMCCTPLIEALTPTADEWERCESIQDTYNLMKRRIRRALTAAQEGGR